MSNHHQQFLRVLHKGLAAPAGPPERLLRDPQVSPTRAELTATCISSSGRPTRGAVASLGAAARDDATVPCATMTAAAATVPPALPTQTVGGNHAAALEQCKAAFEEVVRECAAASKKFFDDTFYFDRRCNVYPEGTPSDSGVGEPRMIRRLGELRPDALLFNDEVNPSCTPVQGALGDGFFIQCITALQLMEAVEDEATHPLTRNFCGYDAATGVCGALLFLNGSWSWVLIDDLLPVVEAPDSEGGDAQLLYCSCEEELWPILLEKAYAKALGCWDLLDGGWPTEAFVNLTGGSVHALEAAALQMSEFDALYVKNPRVASIVSCCTEVLEEDVLTGHLDRDRGLYSGGMYVVIRCVTTSDGHEFVRLRNNFGADGEWAGPYSDDSREWRKNPLHRIELQPEDKTDVGFWMTYKDFCTHFPQPMVCEVLSDATHMTVYRGTADLASERHQPFELKVGGSAPVSVHVMFRQRDPKIANMDHADAKTAPYLPLRVNVYALAERARRAADFMAKVSRMACTTSPACERSVTVKLLLEPGVYGIVPEFCPSESVPENDVGGTLLGEGCETPAQAQLTADYLLRVMREEHARVELRVIPDESGVAAASRRASVAQQAATTEAIVAQRQRASTVGLGFVGDAGSGHSGFAVGGGIRGLKELRQSQRCNGEEGGDEAGSGGDSSNRSTPLTFRASGGLEKNLETAFTLADPWQRGHIDRRMAEQAFAQLLMHSDIGVAFSTLAAERAPLDEEAFKQLVVALLTGNLQPPQSPPSAAPGP